ncbi:hypothetical protein HMPREF1981_02245 [Bacteroides pyogenes F0041]|uniref:Uncharacterized protein n=1 Tax=Bacteroides pyogenes F0041 TaxID=1321819 RepID=U2C2U9_9BACE|nr:hypothetical protein HMPREF1981_02245 [Bacteroides pyogenes F0041]MBB3895300.1 hypothetical protein [Bacteroides pyogenes]SUV70576.1 Uncharacterised protein [Bacteroides pyogenes]
MATAVCIYGYRGVYIWPARWLYMFSGMDKYGKHILSLQNGVNRIQKRNREEEALSHLQEKIKINGFFLLNLTQFL